MTWEVFMNKINVNINKGSNKGIKGQSQQNNAQKFKAATKIVMLGHRDHNSSHKDKKDKK